MKNSSIYSIWKPPGITSYDVIRKIKIKYSSLKKIGHCGTLDPFAEGVLLICTGEKVKDSSKYMQLPKTYIANIIFGKETDTLDVTGDVLKESNKKTILTIDQIKKSIKKFVGSYTQAPPYYSAKKINGIKLYELARKGIFVKPRGSTVKIDSIKVVNFKDDLLIIEINCGSGMYVRSLARDIAYDLDTFCYVNSLKRIKVGDYDANNSILYKNIGQL